MYLWSDFVMMYPSQQGSLFIHQDTVAVHVFMVDVSQQGSPFYLPGYSSSSMYLWSLVIYQDTVAVLVFMVGV